MPGDDKNVIFSAEFDNKEFMPTADSVIDKLVDLKTAQTGLKQEVAATNKELKENEKQLKATKAALDKASDPKEIAKLTQNIKTLSDNNVILTNNLKSANTELIVVSKGVQLYNSEVNKVISNSRALHNSVEKFTNLNKFAAEGVSKLAGNVKQMAFGLISGFAGGIVASVLPAMGEFLNELFNTGKAMSELEKNQKALNDIQEKAVPLYAAQVSKLEIFKAKLDDLTIPEKERIRLAKEYNKTADEGNQISISEINNIGLLNSAIDRQIEKIKQRALARAFENILAEKAEKLFKAQIEFEERRPKIDNTVLNSLESQARSIVAGALSAQGIDILKEKIDLDEIFAFADIPEASLQQIIKNNERFKILLDVGVRQKLLGIRQRINEINKFEFIGLPLGQIGLLQSLQDRILTLQQEFDRTLQVGLSTTTTDAFIPFTKPKDAKEVENVFLQKLKELQARLAELTAKSFESEGNIRKQFAASLAKELQSIDSLEKAGKLAGASGVPGQSQGDVLRQLLGLVTDTQMTKALDEFRAKRLEAQKKVEDAIEAFSSDANLKRIANIGDQFERQRQEIDQRTEALVQTLLKKKADLIAEIDKSGASGADKANSKSLLNAIFKGLLDETEAGRVAAQIKNSFDQFNNAVKEGNVIFEQLQLDNTERTAIEIKDAKALYEIGAINYEEFQKRITKALKDQKAERDRIKLLELNTDLAAINQRLQIETDENNRQELLRQQRAIRNQIASVESGTDKADDSDKKRAENRLKWIKALSDLLGAIVSFWQQVNATEQAALERSISLQEKRVENARDIADKGNAEYLEMEQKRLDELQRKREEAARKQLIVNQALVLSNALLAAVSAIAQAASTSGPAAPFAAIAAGIAVIGAIAAAFAFANSLQTPVASFYEGTEFVDGTGRPMGKDTVPARLHPGERVVTTRENQDYWTALSAIHNRTIPPDVLNSFVEAYPDHGIPLVDFDKLSQATEGSIGSDSYEIRAKLDELNGTMGRVVQSVNEIEIAFRMDEDGFEAAISKAAKKRLLRNKS